MMVFEGIIAALMTSGIAAIYLPFLLLFALFFALLVKTKIFGEAYRINGLVALIISLYIVAFSPISPMLGARVASLFAATGMVLISAIVFFLVVALLVAPWWSEKVIKSGSLWKIALVIGIAVAFLIVTGNAFGAIGPGGEIVVPGLSSQDVVFLALVIITVIIILWLVGGKEAVTGKWSLEPQ